MQQELTTFLKHASYTDFIGFIGQTNIPPGSYSTLQEWAIHGEVNEKSHLFEAACTTGFSSRELVIRRRCSAEGTDLSELSVNKANEESQRLKLQDRLFYKVGPAENYWPEQTPTHVILGAALQFFSNPQGMLNHIVDLFRAQGYGTILASPFWVNSQIPPELIEEAKSTLGIVPTNVGYKEVMRTYRDFAIKYERRIEIVKESEEELAHYCNSTTQRFIDTLSDKVGSSERQELYSIVYDRLYQIRSVCNRLRAHQSYSVLVLEYNPEIYGKRYVELF